MCISFWPEPIRIHSYLRTGIGRPINLYALPSKSRYVSCRACGPSSSAGLWPVTTQIGTAVGSFFFFVRCSFAAAADKTFYAICCLLFSDRPGDISFRWLASASCGFKSSRDVPRAHTRCICPEFWMGYRLWVSIWKWIVMDNSSVAWMTYNILPIKIPKIGSCGFGKLVHTLD